MNQVLQAEGRHLLQVLLQVEPWVPSHHPEPVAPLQAGPLTLAPLLCATYTSLTSYNAPTLQTIWELSMECLEPLFHPIRIDSVHHLLPRSCCDRGWVPGSCSSYLLPSPLHSDLLASMQNWNSHQCLLGHHWSSAGVAMVRLTLTRLAIPRHRWSWMSKVSEKSSPLWLPRFSSICRLPSQKRWVLPSEFSLWTMVDPSSPRLIVHYLFVSMDLLVYSQSFSVHLASTTQSSVLWTQWDAFEESPRRRERLWQFKMCSSWNSGLLLQSGWRHHTVRSVCDQSKSNLCPCFVRSELPAWLHALSCCRTQACRRIALWRGKGQLAVYWPERASAPSACRRVPVCTCWSELHLRSQ